MSSARPLTRFVATGGTEAFRLYLDRPGYWTADRPGWEGKTVPFAPHRGPIRGQSAFWTYPVAPAEAPQP